MDDSAPESLSETSDCASLPVHTMSLFICDTCRYSAELREHQGRSGGVHFAEHIERSLQQQPIAGLQLSRISCLMACKRHCTAYLRSPSKFGYVIGDFSPDSASAQALLDYVAHYQHSPTGQVPYKSWPAAIKGHFIARTPA